MPSSLTRRCSCGWFRRNVADIWLHIFLTVLIHASLSLVFNPITKRMIKYNGPKWKDIMDNTGGFIVYNNTLCGINQNVSNLDTKADEWTILQPSTFDDVEHLDDCDLIDVPYLDELLFVHKPPNMLTLPGIGLEKQHCLAKAVNDWLHSNSDGQKIIIKSKTSEQLHETNTRKNKRNETKTGTFTPRPCHRLDYDTSGVVIFGLSKRALSSTSTLFEEKKIQKQYSALVWGHPTEDMGKISWPIGKLASAKDGYNEFACLLQNSCLVGNRWVDNINTNDFVEGSLRDAHTEYVVSKRFVLSSDSDVKYAKIRLYPKTGRGHQLRLHCAGMKNPILGDILHGPFDAAMTTPRLCLHAEKLSMNVRLNSTSDVFRITVFAPPPF